MDPEIRIKRSSRRKKTVTGRWIDEKLIEILSPTDIDDEALQPIIANLKRRLIAEKERRQAEINDETLEQRAQVLNKKYFNGRLHWNSIRFVTNQRKRFGSCTPKEGTIRISHRLASAPSWVLDYVIMHELAHLRVQNHSQKFWKLVNRYPLTERARGYLIALSIESDQVKEA